jgi:hypothetical protein
MEKDCPLRCGEAVAGEVPAVCATPRGATATLATSATLLRKWRRPRSTICGQPGPALLDPPTCWGSIEQSFRDELLMLELSQVDGSVAIVRRKEHSAPTRDWEMFIGGK